MTSKVYITDIAAFLPNDPVSNDEMEKVLGLIGGAPSRSRKLVLRNNGIKTRYYAIDPRTGKYTHNNAVMAAEAVRELSRRSRLRLDQIECLCCGTSSPDQLKPAHGQMVHGELRCPPCEVVTTAGVCGSGMTALKYAYMNVALGLSRNAVATGSEFASSFMRGSNFEPEIMARIENLEKHPALAFEKDFLRWMLSDGSGAALLSKTPNHDRPSLRIDWIEYASYAGDMPVCMYSGAVKQEDGYLQGWREAEDPLDVIKWNYLAVKQDARLLDEHIMNVCVDRALTGLAAKHRLKMDEVQWFLPHYSSEYFRSKLYQALERNNLAIPYDRWFTNLTAKGNVGSASIYIIMEELLYSGRLKKGERLLCFIPESARFSICYLMMTVV
ncbi:MAG: beta-ketoacyl-ACP synthase III [Deltaproteobacteria bacterium]|nr:beta-ketoacyl-ACP synthase III [Deltaproteobacteria bacterium]